MTNNRDIYEEQELERTAFDLLVRSDDLFDTVDATGADALAAPRPGACDKSPIISKHTAKYQGGFDGGLEIGFKGSYVSGVFSWFSTLDAARSSEDDLDHYIEVAGAVLRVEHGGAKIGGLHYKFHLVWHGIDLYFHTSLDNDYICPVRVRFGAVPLMLFDVRYLYKQVKQLIGAIGFAIVDESVSRADFQIMLPGLSTYDFVSAIQTGDKVSRSRGHYAIHGDLQSMSINSFTVFSRYVELCIYDKDKDLGEKDYVYKRAFDLAYGLPAGKLCRVELRCRGDYLRRYKIRTFDDLIKYAPALVEHLTSDWFRILETKKVRGSENEQAVSPIWGQVRAAFKDVFGRFGAAELERRPRRRVVPDVKRYVQCALGWLTSAAAALSTTCANVDKSDFLSVVNDLVVRFTGSDVMERYNRRVDKLATDGYYD